MLELTYRRRWAGFRCRQRSGVWLREPRGRREHCLQEWHSPADQAGRKKLLNELAEKILSPARVVLLEQRIREHLRDAAQAPARQEEDQPAELRKKRDELGNRARS